jgi:hypothetical protein
MNRLQELAGIINESQLNEGIIDLSNVQVDLLMDKTKYATKPGNSPGVYTVYDLSRPKGAASFGDDMASQKIGFLYTPESKYKAYKFESDDENTVKKVMALKEVANIPSDVKNLGAAQTKATTVQNKAKMINNITEFPGAFENWFNTLGFEPGKISKSSIRTQVEKVLTNLGYK